MDMKLEVVILPVADPDRSKEFYSSLGWRLDADFALSEGSRLIQFTPPGSWCSIQFGRGLTNAEPGSVQTLYLVVSDIDAARTQLVAQGIEASSVFHCADGFTCRFSDNGKRVSAPHPERRIGQTFVTFADPDGNGWLVQEMPKRLPGRVTGNTTFSSARDLAQAMTRASKAHGEHEKRIGQADQDWPAWYAEFMISEQSGAEPPQ